MGTRARFSRVIKRVFIQRDYCFSGVIIFMCFFFFYFSNRPYRFFSFSRPVIPTCALRLCYCTRYYFSGGAFTRFVSTPLSRWRRRRNANRALPSTAICGLSIKRDGRMMYYACTHYNTGKTGIAPQRCTIIIVLSCLWQRARAPLWYAIIYRELGLHKVSGTYIVAKTLHQTPREKVKWKTGSKKAMTWYRFIAESYWIMDTLYRHIVTISY